MELKNLDLVQTRDAIERDIPFSARVLFEVLREFKEALLDHRARIGQIESAPRTGAAPRKGIDLTRGRAEILQKHGVTQADVDRAERDLKDAETRGDYEQYGAAYASAGNQARIALNVLSLLAKDDLEWRVAVACHIQQVESRLRADIVRNKHEDTALAAVDAGYADALEEAFDA